MAGTVHINKDDLRDLSNAITAAIESGFRNYTGGVGGNTNINRNVNSFNDYLYKKIEQGEYKDKLGARILAKESRKEREDELDRRKNGVSKKDVREAAINKINNTINGIMDIAKGLVDIFVAFGEQDIAYSKASLEYNTKITQANLTKQTQIISQGMKSITSSFTKNAVDVSYEFSQASYDIAKTAFSTSMEFKIAEKTYVKSISEANKNLMTGIGAGAMAIGAGIGTLIAPGIGTAIGAVIGGVIGMWDKIWGLDIKKQELAIQQMEQIKSIGEQYQDSFKQIAQPWDDLWKQSTDFTLKLNDSGLKFSRTIGYTSDEFANTMINMSQAKMANGRSMAEVFGKEVEKIPEYMDSYIQSSSRAVNLNATDMGNIMGTARLFGMSGTEASGLYGSMNVFNTSISSASDSMSVMYHQITKMGLSTKKFGKDLVENLKLAQKYNFKSGVENMMKLTKWAQQTRFNLNSAASFSDSIMNDSLSGALEKSAKLQVLGGNAAIYSDPLGMLYDAGADVGNMAQRMASMFGDISGKFNSKTGETEFSWYENRMIAARAQAMGMDVGEAKNMIRQQNKQGVIDRILGGTLSDEDRLAIGNRATYNSKTGNWETVDIHGNKHDIMDYVNGKANIEDLLPADTQEAILDVSEKSLSHLERLDYAVVSRMTKLGSEKMDKIYTSSDKKNETWEAFFKDNWDGVSKNWDLTNKNQEELAQEQVNLMKEVVSNNETLANIYEGNLRSIRDTINEVNGDLLIASREYKKSADAWIAFLEGKTSSPNDKKSFFKGAKEWVQNNWKTVGTTAALTASGSIPHAVHYAYKNFKKQDDGIGYTNGGIITGASHVKSINDGSVNVRTASNDQYLAAMPNGPIDKILQQLIPGLQALLSNSSSNNSANINFNGKIELSQDGSTVNLVDLIKNNPSMANSFIALLQRAMESNTNGKPTNNYKV